MFGSAGQGQPFLLQGPPKPFTGAGLATNGKEPGAEIPEGSGFHRPSSQHPFSLALCFGVSTGKTSEWPSHLGGESVTTGCPSGRTSVTRPASPSLQTPCPPPTASSHGLVTLGGEVSAWPAEFTDPHGSQEALAVTPREEANLG